ncbi:hypothetical protein DL98DRAFT_658640 [Cadophora sp. DSE1049]|nr:hypothetical protein DL98DRAFT_658640 [Cadophora sp. DSE1049]
MQLFNALLIFVPLLTVGFALPAPTDTPSLELVPGDSIQHNSTRIKFEHLPSTEAPWCHNTSNPKVCVFGAVYSFLETDHLIMLFDSNCKLLGNRIIPHKDNGNGGKYFPFQVAVSVGEMYDLPALPFTLNVEAWKDLLQPPKIGANGQGYGTLKGLYDIAPGGGCNYGPPGIGKSAVYCRVPFDC